MNLTLQNKDDFNSTNGVELVEQERQEYYLLGSFHRTAGLKMFGYNHFENKVFEITIKYSNTIHLVPIDGKLIPVDYEAEKTTVDSRFKYFECLNMNSAIKRVNKYKNGKLIELSNLKTYTGNTINFF